MKNEVLKFDYAEPHPIFFNIVKVDLNFAGRFIAACWRGCSPR